MTWATDIQAVHEESAGVPDLQVVMLADVPELLLTTLAGDPKACQLTVAFTGALATIRQAPRRRPMLCGSCPRPLRGDFAVVIASPHRDDHTHRLTLAICARCATEPAQVKVKATRALRRIWPHARLIEVGLHPPGRA